MSFDDTNHNIDDDESSKKYSPNSNANISTPAEKNIMKKFPMIVLLVVLVGSAFAVQSDRSDTTTTTSSSSSSTMRKQQMSLVSRSSSVMDAHSEEAAMDMADDMGASSPTRAKMASKKEDGGRSMGGEVLEAFQQNMEELHASNSNKVTARMLVHTGHLSLWTWKGQLLSVVDQVETLLQQDDKGYVESRSSYNNGGEEQPDQKLLVMDLQLRIASEHFHSIISSIQALVGENMVISLSTNSRDVTDSYVDATSRADTLEASRKALRLLLEKAGNVNDVMNVQRELNRLTQQYESERSRATNLKKQADYSSLSLHLQEKAKRNDSDEPSWWTPTASLYLAWQHMSVFCVFVVDTVIYAATWILPLLLLYVAFVRPFIKSK